jgi:hypothetical protein
VRDAHADGSVDPVGPFGNPDGSRAEIQDILDGFVDFGGNPAFGALAMRANDATARVIVGRLGAGKTVYLRRLRSYQATQDSVFAGHLQQTLPATELIVRVCQLFPEQFLTEKWMQMWNRAIMRSLATILLATDELNSYVPNYQAELIKRDYGKLIGSFRRPRSIYSELRGIMNLQQTARQLTTYLENPAWDDLEDLLAEILRRCPPIFLYLDAVDEEFSHAPMYWLRCQKGLFYQVMRLLRDAKLGGRLHVVICLRDIALSSVYRSEHAPRYHNEPHIRILSWTRESMEYLLHEKLKKLPRSRFMDGPVPTVQSWLGVSYINNEKRRVYEEPLDYLLRHTRLIPRDIVSLGNALCEEVVRQKAAGRAEFPQAALRSIVSRSSKRFGDSQLAQSSNQIAADMMPLHAASQRYSDLYTGTMEYLAGVDRQLRAIIREVGRDRFTREELELMRRRGHQEFEDATDLPSVLWQNGLLGYVETDGEARFYSLTDMDEFDMPIDAREYVFHPCVLDSTRIKGVGAPVYPFKRPED